MQRRNERRNGGFYAGAFNGGAAARFLSHESGSDKAILCCVRRFGHICKRAYPCLTTVGQDAYERAKAAVAALQKLKAGEITEAVQKIHVYLVERESVGEYDAT